MKPVVDAVGGDEMVRRLKRYTSMTQAQFSSLTKFAETHGSYAAVGICPEGDRKDVSPRPRPNAEIERLKKLEADIAHDRDSTSNARGTL